MAKRTEPLAPAALSVNEFCSSHSISKAFFYLLLKRAEGPRLMKVGGRTLISVEAAAEWRDRMQSAAQPL